MTNLFLKAKHWQIFVPLLIIPFVAMIIFMGVFFSRFLINPPQRPQDMLGFFYFMPVFMFCAGFVQYAWFWSVLTKLPNTDRIQNYSFPKTRIKIFFWIPIIYFLFMPLLMANMIGGFTENGPANIGTFIGSMLLMFFGNLAAVFFLIHTVFFTAKIIKTGELNRQSSFSDFVGEFFLILFFPVGIWFIQPIVNKIYANEYPLEHNNDSIDII